MKTLEHLVEAGKIPSCVYLTYYKPNQDDPPTRLVEPYCFTDGRADVLLRAYQREPEEGWRLFKLDQIEGVEIANIKFRPRTTIMLSDDMEQPVDAAERAMAYYAQQQEEEPEAYVGKEYKGKRPDLAYRRRVLDVLADMSVTFEESAELAEFKREQKLDDAVVRGIHYQIFYKGLSAVLRDKIVDQAELDYLRALNSCLQKCGAGILE